MTQTTSSRSKECPWAPSWAPPVSLNGPLGGPRAPQKTTRNSQGGPGAPRGPQDRRKNGWPTLPGAIFILFVVVGKHYKHNTKQYILGFAGSKTGPKPKGPMSGRPFGRPEGAPGGARGPVPLRFGPLRFGRPCRPIRQFLEFFPGALLGPLLGAKPHISNGF